MRLQGVTVFGTAISAAVLAAALLLAIGDPGETSAADAPQPPNVILILADGPGHGDWPGSANKRIVKTFALDMFHGEAARLTNFHVDPASSPTRAALMTGRYSCRTGVWHTMMGRSLLRRDEKTMADIFAAAGYRTAIFGKWHLGDNYPYRAVDRGFHESLVHGGGGIGEAPDWWGNACFDPVLCHNGKWKKQSGYCTDIFFAAATRFIEANRAQPLFVYIPTSMPPPSYQVAQKYTRPYLEAGVKPDLAQFYGMIANLDENFGRLLTRLDQWGLSQNTIVVFMAHSGGAGGGGSATVRGQKGSGYDAGHPVPCFIRWPAKLKGGYDVDLLTAQVDILPTLLDLCNIRKPKDLKFDGKGLLPLLVRVEDWAPRTLFVQSHGIEMPQMWRNSAVMYEEFHVLNRPGEYTVKNEYRLLSGRQLYDIKKDPGQLYDLSRESPKTVDKLRFDYEEWYKEVSARFGEYCEIVLGSPRQNPTELNCMDWHGPSVPWEQIMVAGRMQANGFWAVEVERAGRYQFTLRERPAVAKFPLKPGLARLQIGQTLLAKAIPAGATSVTFDLDLKPGKTRVQTWLIEPGGAARGAYYVEVKYLAQDAGKDEG
jgi:arylsulfatase A-like enzyme